MSTSLDIVRTNKNLVFFKCQHSMQYKLCNHHPYSSVTAWLSLHGSVHKQDQSIKQNQSLLLDFICKHGHFIINKHISSDTSPIRHEWMKVYYSGTTPVHHELMKVYNSGAPPVRHEFLYLVLHHILHHILCHNSVISLFFIKNWFRRKLTKKDQGAKLQIIL